MDIGIRVCTNKNNCLFLLPLENIPPIVRHLWLVLHTQNTSVAYGATLIVRFSLLNTDVGFLQHKLLCCHYATIVLASCNNLQQNLLHCSYTSGGILRNCVDILQH